MRITIEPVLLVVLLLSVVIMNVVTTERCYDVCREGILTFLIIYQSFHAQTEKMKVVVLLVLSLALAREY
jgi:hypothetical protein